MSKLIKIGDVFEIGLSDGRKCYGQYIFKEPLMGPIIRIFNFFIKDNEEVSLEKIITTKLLFPPIHAGINFPIKEGIWKIVGTLPVNDYEFKGFITFSDDNKGNINKWFFWDGKKSISLGEKLPKEYMTFEERAVYQYDLIAQRIETGFDMFEYPKKHNRFLTKGEIKKKYPKIKL